MNERIRKIESQAWEKVNRTNGLVRTEDFYQKFAELIVRECLSQLYELTPPIISNQNHQKLVDATYMMAMDIGVAKIKKHFGVEE